MENKEEKNEIKKAISLYEMAGQYTNIEDLNNWINSLSKEDTDSLFSGVKRDFVPLTINELKQEVQRKFGDFSINTVLSVEAGVRGPSTNSTIQITKFDINIVAVLSEKYNALINIVVIENLTDIYLDISPSFLHDHIMKMVEGVEVTSYHPLKDNEKSQLHKCVNTKKIEIFTNSIQLNNQQKKILYNRYSEAGYTLQISDVVSRAILRKGGLEGLHQSISTFRYYLDKYPDSVEQVQQDLIDDDMRLLTLYGAKYISQPEGFSYPDGKESGENQKSFVPDFLVKLVTGQYLIIEIERANKQIIVKSGQQSAKFTQAKDQIDRWRTLITNYGESLNKKYPGITANHNFLLVIGRDSEFCDKEEKEYFFQKIKGGAGDITLWTYDDLLKNTQQVIDNNNLKVSK